MTLDKLTPSTEALNATARRAAVEKKIISTIKIMDPDGDNAKRYTDLFKAMNNAEFHAFMEDLRSGKRKLIVYTPNMTGNLHIDNLLKAAEAINLKVFHRLRIWDTVGRRYYLTPNEYLVLPLPIRRLKQYREEKASIPESDEKIDLATGQVVKPDKGSSMSMTQMQTMASKGLTSTITEMITVRGGNPTAYAGFKASLSETGSASLKDVDPEHRARSVVTTAAYLRSMMIENNL